MAPRKAKEEPLDEDHVESKRLTERAMELGVLSRTRCLSSTILPPTKLMLRADGKDIVKKGSSRKGRYLLVFNFQLAPAAAGKLGTLTRLDSPNPVMYLDFPQGRYKMFGTLVFPRNKYVVLRMGQKDVLCEDVLESMVVFSEGWWIGSAEDNPEEKRLAEPDWLAQPAVHLKYDFSGRGTAGAGGGASKEADAAEAMDDDDEEEPASQRPQRRASRPGGRKRLRYNEDSGRDTEDEGDSEEEDLAPRKLPRLGSQQQRQQRKAQAKQQPESHPIDLAVHDSDEDEPLTGRAAAKPQQGTLDAFFKKSGSSQIGSQQAAKPSKGKTGVAAKSKAGAKLTSGGGIALKRQVAAAAAPESDDADEVVDLAGSSEEEAPPSSARPRSQRKAAGAAAKKLQVEHDSDDELDEIEHESVSGDRNPSEGGSSEGEEAEGLEQDSSDADSDAGGSDGNA